MSLAEAREDLPRGRRQEHILVANARVARGMHATAKGDQR